MPDQNLICITCNRSFVYSERERLFMEDLKAKGQFDQVASPTHCIHCRRLRRVVPIRGPLSAPLQIPETIRPVAKPASHQNGAAHIPEPDIRCVLVAADFEKLVCREEVVIHQGNRKVRLILADIGLPAMKVAMEKAALSWWKS